MELATDSQRKQDAGPPAPVVAPPQPVVAPPAVQQANAQAGATAIARMSGDQEPGKQPSPTAVAQAAAIPPGTAARLTVQAEAAQPDGKRLFLAAGTLVTVVGVSTTNPGKLTVQTQAGLVVEISVSASELKAEPQVMQTDETTAKYGEVHGNLWDPATGPQPEDARNQGMAGDCYFISSMAAICAQNPKQIEALFNVNPKPGEPAHKSYVVALWKPDATGKLQRTTTKVDRYVPESPQAQLQYDGYGATAPKTPGAPAAPATTTPVAPARGEQHTKQPQLNFWPELLEKAFAQVYGSYDNIGNGGLPAAALEALTGVQADEQMAPQFGGNLAVPPGVDAGTFMLQKFKTFEQQHRAVVVATRSEVGGDPRTGQFGLVGDHAYQFIRSDGANLIFRNPWGTFDPQPVPAASFLNVFFYIGDTLGSIPMKPAPDAAPGPAQVANAAQPATAIV